MSINYPLKMTGDHGRAEAALLVGVLIWGLNYPALKYVMADIHPFVVNALRFTIAVLVVGIVYAWNQHRIGQEFFAPVRTHGRQLFSLGVFGHVVLQILFILGVSLTTAGMAALLSASIPVWTALISRVFRVERLGRKAWVGLAVAVIGTVVVVLPEFRKIGTVAGSAVLLGNLLILASALVSGMNTAFNKPILERVSALAVTFFGLLSALPFLWTLVIPYVEWQAFTRIDYRIWGILLFSGGLSTGLAPIWWKTAIKELGPSITGVYNNGVPIIALSAGAVFLGEQVTFVHVAGAVLIIGGVFSVRKNQGQPDSPPLVHPLHVDCPPTHLCRLRTPPLSQTED